MIGIAYVAVEAVVSSRLRRRDEVASLLGAPVELSLKPVRIPKRRSERWIRSSALEPQGEVATFSGYLRRRGVSHGEGTTVLLVALDDLTVPAAALGALAKRMADRGESVLVADLTSEGILARVLRDLPIDGPTVADRPGGTLQVFMPSPDAMGEITEPTWAPTGDGARSVLVLSTIDPAGGAWHLSWAKEAIVSVTAGRSSAQRVSSAAVLLRAAGITIRSGVLIGTDAQDESIGLLQPDTPLVGLPIDGVVSA